MLVMESKISNLCCCLWQPVFSYPSAGAVEQPPGSLGPLLHLNLLGIDLINNVNYKWKLKDLSVTIKTIGEVLSYTHTERQAARQASKCKQGPIGMHCDTPKSVPDPFPSVTLYIMVPMDPK